MIPHPERLRIVEQLEALYPERDELDVPVLLDMVEQRKSLLVRWGRLASEQPQPITEPVRRRIRAVLARDRRIVAQLRERSRQLRAAVVTTRGERTQVVDLSPR